ncbi:CPBP family glutamic-type intramembrane protease [Shewanella sp. Isolate11]|uniref:CPBP family glutamic-type intramembrane protease n=1 Tax=Shewanella sp. Isolate11 TaxID=2908530 RepID=UPI001EFECF63|nr:CPBP family glutamic-type intramembrane protease [Shewanella sp. Isolate11]MCG9695595.1 CPBP family glutamic-type intramembrane protease [Shewanella sp. Isolate11]
MNTKNQLTAQAKMLWIERGSSDFPYYQGDPILLNGKSWLIAIASTLLAFAILLIPSINGYLGFLKSITFVVLPLVTLNWVSKGHWQAIFKPIKFKDILWMIFFGLLTLTLTVALGYLVSQFFETAKNPIIKMLAEKQTSELVLLLISTLPQLVGEELITIFPFLAMMYLFVERLKWSRTQALLCSWLLSSLYFGALHLHTYDWNLAQCLILIGTARLILTLAYLKTKNLLVCSGAHIINDWTIFFIALIAAKAAG